VLSVGVDLVPALDSQGFDTENLVQSVATACLKGGGQGLASESVRRAIRNAGGVLNIAWISEAVDSPASMICPRSVACPRPVRCEELPSIAPTTEISDVRHGIIEEEAKTRGNK
jgi:hypothetical protein